jgi:hypothetical protein
MTDTVYGITPPRILKGWEACSMDTESARAFMRRHLVPEGYGAPIRCVAWERGNGDLTLVVAEYPNGRRAEVRRSGHDFSTTLKWWSKPSHAHASADGHQVPA